MKCNLSNPRRAVAQVVSRRIPTAAARVRAQGHMGVVEDKPALRRVFSEYFDSPANHSIDCSTFIIIHHHPGPVQEVK
jgi:hypothetical protein